MPQPAPHHTPQAAHGRIHGRSAGLAQGHWPQGNAGLVSAGSADAVPYGMDDAKARVAQLEQQIAAMRAEQQPQAVHTLGTYDYEHDDRPRHNLRQADSQTSSGSDDSGSPPDSSDSDGPRPVWLQQLSDMVKTVMHELNEAEKRCLAHAAAHPTLAEHADPWYKMSAAAMITERHMPGIHHLNNMSANAKVPTNLDYPNSSIPLLPRPAEIDSEIDDNTPEDALTQPSFQPLCPLHPDDMADKPALARFDIGYSAHVLSPTGALVGVVAALRHSLWQITGSAEANTIQIRYNWQLHDWIKDTMTLSHLNSFMHATLAMPLCSTIPAGLDWPVGSNHGLITVNCTRPGKYFEPSFLLCPLEDYIPIPAPFYACARAQKAFLWKYMQMLGDSCDYISRCGDYQQRETDWSAVKNTTSIAKLETEAVNSMKAAVDYVQQHLQATPVKGNLWGTAPLQSPASVGRRCTTNCFNDNGNMITNIPDCTCRHCTYINSTNRFAEVYLQDGPITPLESSYSEPY